MSGDVRDLLEAGAVLPAGTEGAGEEAVPLTARAYRHPGLEDRVVVRLADAALGAAEDAASGFLGLVPEGEPQVVGLGKRAALGFPEWVLAYHPEDGHHALAVVPEMERITQRAKTKPKLALDGFHELAGTLAASVPHLLPTFYERAGREFLAVENLTYASQMFTHARRTEVEHGLPIDEVRLDAVFLEFALAGALPVKTLSGYARELANRVPAEEALRRFTHLCVRRTVGGLSPSAQMAAELRRLARTAGQSVESVEAAYLEEMLALPATVQAAPGWWKAHRAALLALAGENPAVRGRLLNLTPASRDGELPSLWLEILEESGASAALCDPDGVPREALPEDGGVGWLKRFLSFALRGRRVPPPELYPLVERMAGRLKEELAASGERLDAPSSPDLLDLLLALGVPVADAPENHALRVEDWAGQKERRDLLALAADGRFQAAFDRGTGWIGGDKSGLHALRTLAASPGGRPLLTAWMEGVARQSSAVGLPGLPQALARFRWLPGEVLALAEDAVRRVVTAGLAPLLVRTLRAGIPDELVWPAWEEAIDSLGPSQSVVDLVVADAWPHLVVSSGNQARVIGREGTVLVHDLRIPAGDLRGDPGFHYVDGELLVHWSSRQSDRIVGYWHSSADRVLPLETGGVRATRMYWYREDPVSLSLPGGGRTTGMGVVHPGDTTLPAARRIIGDGTSYWLWTSKEGEEKGSPGWYEYDPVSGEHGRRSMPGFLADALRGLPDEAVRADAGWLLPVPYTGPTPSGTPVNGLLGWRVVNLPGDVQRGEDLSGNTVTAPRGSTLFAPLYLPGDERPRALLHHGYQVDLADRDGIITAFAKTDQAPGPFGEGSRILPPLRYWHCMNPRDPRGSLALRRIEEEAASSLLKAASDEDGLFAAVHALLPDVTDPALVKGVAGVVRYAAEQQKTLDEAVERLEEVLSPGFREREEDGPEDRLVQNALDGLGYRNSWSYGNDRPMLFSLLRTLARTVEEEPEAQSGLHLDGIELPSSVLHLHPLAAGHAAIAYRAVSALTPPEHREALEQTLRAIAGLGIIGGDGRRARWKSFRLHLDTGLLTLPGGEWRRGHWYGLLPLGGGAFLAAEDNDSSTSTGGVFTMLFHDPEERFEVPAPYTVRSSSPLGAPESFPLDVLWAEAAERGPVPWFPEAAEEFARLTGVSRTMAALVVAGLPGVDGGGRDFLPAGTRTALKVKTAEAAVARTELRALKAETKQAVVGALIPADPALLWTSGPDVAAAAEVWNARVGQRVAVPEEVMSEAVKAVRTGWEITRALPALFDPPSEPRLSRDLKWKVQGDHVTPEEEGAVGFTGTTLVGAVATTAWLAHRLAAGDPLRERLPAALSAVRARLANPDLMLGLDGYSDLKEFRKVAGAPSEVGEGFERYGAIVMATADNLPYPGIKTALLDESGSDPYLPVLNGGSTSATVVALRIARDPRFAGLVADPGDPAAGERGKDGTWWPQDPSRSVPDLVAAVAERFGLSADAATVYLMVLAMPDPTDRATARWTGWKPARLKAARAELAATDLVIEAKRVRAGRTLFLPGGWITLRTPHLPLEEWKFPLYDLAGQERVLFGALVPIEPAADLYRRVWRRIEEGDVPRFAELQVKRGRRR